MRVAISTRPGRMAVSMHRIRLVRACARAVVKERRWRATPQSGAVRIRGWFEDQWTCVADRTHVVEEESE